MPGTIHMPSIAEIVCTANHGRSPLAEAFGRRILNELGASGYYDTASGGTMAEQNAKGSAAIEAKIRMAGKALRRMDVYSAAERATAEFALGVRHETLLTPLYLKARAQFAEEERSFRKEAEGMYGLDGLVKQFPEQATCQENRVLVLAMGLSHLKAMMALYREMPKPPVIMLLGDYALGMSHDCKPTNAVPDVFGGTREQYLDCIGMVIEYTQSAMIRLFEEDPAGLVSKPLKAEFVVAQELVRQSN